MKRFILLLASLLVMTGSFAQDATRISPKTKLLVYYFHITNRCHTCTSIEAAVRKALQENFKAEMDSSILVFKTFNVDLPENEAISKKYDAYGATLALTKLRQGKEQIVDMTNYAFAKIHNEPEFINGLKEKISELLK